MVSDEDLVIVERVLGLNEIISEADIRVGRMKTSVMAETKKSRRYREDKER